ncbi:MAG: polysaccharide export protein [Acidobacteriales bacterium]|nr:polysaccharide export protein [Terriglobales bacterium]
MRQNLWHLIIVVGFCIISSGISAAQQQTDSAPLSADQIIRILQANPELLGEAKAQIQNASRDSAYPLSESQITDDRVFSRIRSDDQFRTSLSAELKERGYSPQPAESQNTTVPTDTNPNIQPRSEDNKEQPSTGAVPVAQGERSDRALPHDSPYRNLPAFKDLYTQTQSDPEKLERFGAALFRNSRVSDKTSMDVPVGSDYVLGTGDEVVVSYWGSASQRLRLIVDREGRLTLPESGAIMVAGRSLADVQRLLQGTLAKQFRNVTVDVSLGRIRNVRVFVVGDVKRPGAYEISALSTVLSALLVAGGPNDTGSLRSVKHFRGKKLIEDIDLYELMLSGISSAVERIESSDSILVPPAGAQVTVAGMVRRPAIYELRNEQSLDQVLGLAGGVLVTGDLRNIKVARIEAHERKVMLNVNLPRNGNVNAVESSFKNLTIKDGDDITISPILPYSGKTVYLQGHVFRPGKYPYRDGIKFTDIVASYQDLLPEPAERAEIIRLRPPDYRPFVIGFNLQDVLQKRREAPALQPFDTVRIFGRYESDSPKVSIYGEVLRPAEYLLSDRMTAADLVRMAGGFKRSAFTESAGLASYSIQHGERVELERREVAIGRALAGEPDTDVVLKPGDVLTIHQLGGWKDIGGAIVVNGEVLHPGRYGIQEGERLSSILKRAGGFMAEAYPTAAILDREQVRQVAAAGRDELINTLQSQSVDNDRAGKTENVAVNQERQQLINKLKQIQPTGRLVIHISPDIASWENTAADIEVRSGDKLNIPKKPNFVMVGGQVYNPTALTYAPGKAAGWYLKQAGGPTVLANKKQVLVIRANGIVLGKSSGGWWSGDVLSTVLQPGDTVYVPERYPGNAKMKAFVQAISVLSGVAATARIWTLQ